MQIDEATATRGALVNRRILEVDVFSKTDDAIVLRLDDGSRVYLMSAARGNGSTLIQAEIRT